jgi:hypothetical protein
MMGSFRHKGLAELLERGYFLAVDEPISQPRVEVILGGQTQERWSHLLFVSYRLALEALDFVLDTGRQKPGLRWLRGDEFNRLTVWESHEG